MRNLRSASSANLPKAFQAYVAILHYFPYKQVCLDFMVSKLEARSTLIGAVPFGM